MDRRTTILQFWLHGFFVVGEKQSHCCYIAIAPECAWYWSHHEKMRLFPLSLLTANTYFGRHGQWCRFPDLSSLGNMLSWKRARSVGLSSVRTNSGTTIPRGAGSAAADSAATSTSGSGTGGATSTESPLLFPGLPSEISPSPAVVVTNKLWIFLVAATALRSRRFAARTLRRRHTNVYSLHVLMPD